MVHVWSSLVWDTVNDKKSCGFKKATGEINGRKFFQSLLNMQILNLAEEAPML